MLHGLKESRAAGKQNTFGVKGGLTLYRKVGGVKHSILSHHSELQYSGLLMKLLRTNDTQRTLDWGDRGGSEVHASGGPCWASETKGCRGGKWELLYLGFLG